MNVVQLVEVLGQDEKWSWLANRVDTMLGAGQLLVFVNSIEAAEELSANFTDFLGKSAGSVHNGLDSRERWRVVESFQKAKLAVLIATDIDTPLRLFKTSNVTVVSHDPPYSIMTHTKRVGMAGGAGGAGEAYTLLNHNDQAMAALLVEHFKQISHPINEQLQSLSVRPIAPPPSKEAPVEASDSDEDLFAPGVQSAFARPVTTAQSNAALTTLYGSAPPAGVQAKAQALRPPAGAQAKSPAPAGVQPKALGLPLAATAAAAAAEAAAREAADAEAAEAEAAAALAITTSQTVGKAVVDKASAIPRSGQPAADSWNRFKEDKKYTVAADTNVNPKHVGEGLRKLTLEDRLELRRKNRELEKKGAIAGGEIEDALGAEADDDALKKPVVNENGTKRSVQEIDDDDEDIAVIDGLGSGRSTGKNDIVSDKPARGANTSASTSKEKRLEVLEDSARASVTNGGAKEVVELLEDSEAVAEDNSVGAAARRARKRRKAMASAANAVPAEVVEL